MLKLGLAIITFNEERLIEKVIKSVPFASEIIVVDSFSSDNTKEIAESCGAKVIQREWQGYANQKQFCLEQIKSDWILVLDGDEYLSHELQMEIQETLINPQFDAYQLKRHLVFLGKELQYGRGVDFQLRLLKKGCGKYTQRNIHEEIITSGSVAKLKNPIIHHSAETIAEQLEKINRDTEMEIPNYNNQKIGFKEVLFQPILFFITMTAKGSWRDGLPGMIFLSLTTFKYIILRSKLYEIYKSSNR